MTRGKGILKKLKRKEEAEDGRCIKRGHKKKWRNQYITGRVGDNSDHDLLISRDKDLNLYIKFLLLIA